MSKITTYGLTWREVSLPASLASRYVARLTQILAAWEGTPYGIGQQCKGAGVDCVRFVCAVLDEFFHRPATPIATLPDDACLHTREGAIAGMRAIRERYMPNDPVEDGSLEPGDVVVVGPVHGGPGHAMIVGTQPNTIWHAAGDRVHFTGVGFYEQHHKVFRVYRMRDRMGACS